MIPVADAFDDPRYESVTCSCGSQMGKSEIMLNIFGKRFDDGPRVPCLMVQPNEKLTRSFSNDRVMKMINSAENLANKLDRGQKDKVTEKFIAGIRWGFAWAGSATELASHPVGLAIIDEVDRMASNVGTEGDPVILVAARLKNYFSSTLGCFSTPTVWPGSKITQLWFDGTMGKFSWCCPHCLKYFAPQFKYLTWNESHSLTRIRTETFLTCPNCKGVITDKHKIALNGSGRYEYNVLKDPTAEDYTIIPYGPEPPENRNASFWVSGICSPWQTMGDIAHVVVKARRSKDQESEKAAINTFAGECFEEKGEGAKWQSLFNLVGQYEAGTVPEGVQLLTLGADVQGLGIYWVVRGWGYNNESWKIENGFVPGETEYQAVWKDFSRIIEKDFSGMRLKRAFIDSGFNTSMVYQFSLRFPGLVFPTKGQDNQIRPLIMSKVELSLHGKIKKGGIKLYHTDTNHFKRWLFSRYSWPITESGSFHLDKDTTDDYLKQITAEQMVINPKGVRSWKQIRSDNHYLDAEVNNAAAAYSLQVHSLPETKSTQKTNHKPKTALNRKPFIKSRPNFLLR